MKQPTKKVTYMGQEFEVPDWTTHIAVDPAEKTNTVYAFDHEPCFTPWELGSCVPVGQLNFPVTAVA